MTHWERNGNCWKNTFLQKNNLGWFLCCWRYVEMLFVELFYLSVGGWLDTIAVVVVFHTYYCKFWFVCDWFVFCNLLEFIVVAISSNVAERQSTIKKKLFVTFLIWFWLNWIYFFKLSFSVNWIHAQVKAVNFMHTSCTYFCIILLKLSTNLILFNVLYILDFVTRSS